MGSFRDDKIKGGFMKKVMIILSLIAILLTGISVYAQQPADIQGWNGAKWGMSKAEIMKLFKDEIVLLDKKESYMRSYAEIGLNDYKIGNYLYNVRFLMDGSTNKLLQVNITKSPNNSITKGVTKTDYEVLERLLFDKYGKWSYKTEDKTPDERISRTVVLDGSETIRTSWNLKSTVIELSYTKLASNMPIYLTLTYKQKKVADNKL